MFDFLFPLGDKMLVRRDGRVDFGLFRETAQRDRAYAALEQRLPDGYRIFSATTLGYGLRIV